MKLTLSRRVFIYFLIVILVSLITTASITYWQSSREIDRYIYKQMSQTINNAVHHTNIYLMDYEQTVLSLLDSEQVKKYVALPADAYYEQYQFGSVIRDIYFKNAIFRNPEIASVYLLSSNGQSLAEYGNLRGLKRYNQESVIDAAYDTLNNQAEDDRDLQIFDHSVVSPEETGLLTVSKRIPSLQNIYKYTGIIAIEFHKNNLERLWKEIDLGERGYFFVMDNSGKIVYHPDASSIGTQLDGGLSDNLLNRPGQLLRNGSGLDERMLLSRPTDFPEWNLVVSMPRQDLRKPIDNIRTNTIYMSIITLIIALLFASRFGRAIIGPIRTLKRGMVETEKGNWIQLPLTGRNDEMDDLTKRYNMMVKRLSELVDQVYMAELKDKETQMDRQKAELQALQLQVNPHFLYNTLETIACYAVIKDSNEITDIVKHLSQMLRYAVRTDLEEVTVANELQHVLNYLNILNHRTGWNFEMDVVIPPEYLLRNMVRLTLQPLVENVFKHAFPGGLEAHHFIRIDAFMLDDEFIITIEDNGAGIPADVLSTLNQKISQKKTAEISAKDTGGIGLVNVHRRIQMVFGDKYGLKIESTPLSGTKMFLRMPRYREE